MSADTLARCQRAIATLYRQRARERLAKARQTAIEHRRAVIEEALTWRAFANEWSRKAREGMRPVNHA